MCYRFPETVGQLREQYPVAFEYLINKSKNPICIMINKGHVLIKDQFGWLKYDIQDIKIFNQLEVNGL